MWAGAVVTQPKGERFVLNHTPQPQGFTVEAPSVGRGGGHRIRVRKEGGKSAESTVELTAPVLAPLPATPVPIPTPSPTTPTPTPPVLRQYL